MRPVRRRTFVVWLVGGSIAALVTAVSGVLALFVWPRARRKPLVIHLPKALADIKDGEAIRINCPSHAAFVMADGAGNNHGGDLTDSAWIVRSCGSLSVLAANCSHLGCRVDFLASEQKFRCPCHGSTYGIACHGDRSEFAVDGAVLRGPAAFSLAHIRSPVNIQTKSSFCRPP